MQSDAPLRAQNVSYSYADAEVLHDVSIEIGSRETVALAGPNGSGKTTLLKLLSGVRRPGRGAVTLGGEDARRLSPAQLARRIAVVPQSVDPRLSFRVEAVVAMGRNPYARALAGPARADREAVERALDLTETAALRERPFNELSGGEQQRVTLATALAQEARYLLLDEPTVHLDLHHQHEVLELIVRLQQELGISVLAVMHDLNLAALYFERLALLEQGRLRADGPPAHILRRPELLEIFRAPVHLVVHPQTGVPQVLLSRGRRGSEPN